MKKLVVTVIFLGFVLGYNCFLFAQIFEDEELIYNAAEFEAAISEFEKIVKLEPENKKAQSILNMLKDQAKKKQEAQKFYDKGKLLYKDGKWEQALKAFEVALTFEPDNRTIKRAFLAAQDHLITERKFTLDFKDESLKDILLALGDTSGIDIMVPEDMDIKVTVKVKELTFHETLDTILKDTPYTYEEGKNLIKIIPKEKLVVGPEITPEEKLVNQVFKDIAFGDLMEALKRMLGINVIYDSSAEEAKSKLLTLSVSEMTLQETFDLVLKMSGLVAKKYNQNTYILMTKEAAIDTVFDEERRIQRVFELSNVQPAYIKSIVESSKVLKEKLNINNYTLINKRSTGISPTGEGTGFMGILAFDTPENLALLEKLIKAVDIKRRQVTISVRIMSVESSAARELGLDVDFNPSTQVTAETPPDRSLDAKIFEDFAGRLVWKDDPNIVGKIIRNFSLSATLDFLTSHSLSRTIASPSIRVLDGESATIAITDTVPVKYPKYISAVGPQGEPVVHEGWEWKDEPFGITLNITPYIHDNKEVTLQFQLDNNSKGIEVEGHPGKSGTQATTVVRVRDGETVIMGGLVDKSNSKEKRNIPFVEKIPFLGKLFEHISEKDERNKEMVIFLTPYFVSNEDEVKEENDKLKILESSGAENYSQIIGNLKERLKSGSPALVK